MDNNVLLNLLESVLGKGISTSKGNYAFKCPFCNHHKNKLEINLNTNEKGENPYHCWTCINTKGKKISTLFKKLKVPSNKLYELNLIIQPGKTIKYNNEQIQLPDEFISLIDITNLNKIDSLDARRAIRYLKKRNITAEDILKYNIGFCNNGKYSNRIIIPSYDKNGIINYFIAREYTDETFNKYKNPPISNKIIGWELYINWDAPIILCEGIFDALTIKRNVIPLFGKTINEILMAKLVSSNVNRIYIALDKDAIKDAINHCKTLMSYGKEVFLLELDGKDASSLGFEIFFNTIEKTPPLNFQKLMEIKLSLC
jgi:DNA primase